MPAARIKWDGIPNLVGCVHALGPFTHAQLARVLAQQAAVAEGDAKVTAPWTDRTGAARNGLYATSRVAPGRGELEIGHGVDYGIWLEIKNSGRYAAVLPTLQRTVPRVAQALGGLW